MSDELDNGAVERVLADFKDPETGRSALQLDQIRDIQLSGTDLETIAYNLVKHLAESAAAAPPQPSLPVLG